MDDRFQDHSLSVEGSRKKDGHQRWPHRLHAPPLPTQPQDPLLRNASSIIVDGEKYAYCILKKY